MFYFAWTPLLLPGLSPALDDCDWFKEIKTGPPSFPTDRRLEVAWLQTLLLAVVWYGFARLGGERPARGWDFRGLSTSMTWFGYCLLVLCQISYIFSWSFFSLWGGGPKASISASFCIIVNILNNNFI